MLGEKESKNTSENECQIEFMFVMLTNVPRTYVISPFDSVLARPKSAIFTL